MTWARVARAVAWTVALAALVDPVLSLEREAPVPLRVVTVPSPGLDLPATGGENRRVTLRHAVAALERQLGARFVVQHVEAAGTDPADWCAGAGACLLVGDDTVAPAGTSVSIPHFALLSRDEPSPNVAVRHARAWSPQHPEAFGRLSVDLEGRGVEGRRTSVRVLDGTRELGVAHHQWRDGETRIELAVEWWPVDEGMRVLSIEAVPFDDEATIRDNRASTVVHVLRRRLPVLVYEPRPSWASTFVRRALEDDPRLQVEARSRLGPRVGVTTTAAPALTPRALDDVALVVVGGLDELSRADVALLRRYVERRGGSLVVLPDRMPAGPSLGLVPGRLQQRLLARPADVGALRATELAIMDAPGPVSRVLAALEDGTAVVVESPTGRGRIVVSGAMDAWRYRGDDEAFSAFWQALAARLALETGPAFDVRPAAARLGVGERVSLAVESRTLAEGAADWPAVSAWLTCEGAGQTPLRVWPDAAPGGYRVDVSVESAGSCTVEVAPTDRPQVARSVPVEVVEVADVVGYTSRRHRGALERLARSRAGRAFDVGDADALPGALAAAVTPHRVAHDVRPMRAPWWMLLFAGALGGEWWIRRRRGLR